LYHRIETMSFLIEWQKKQKALKDAERDRKMNASSLLHRYRGGEHDIKDQKQQKALKDAERDRKMNASSLLHSYRGGEHDIKDQKQQKALKDADRDSKMNASSLLHSYRGGEHDIKDQNQKKVLKDAERDSKNNVSLSLYNRRGGEHDINKNDRVIIEERKENHARENAEQDISHASAETKSGTETKISIGDGHSGKSRKSQIIDFSFGIIYPDFEPKPGADLCALAASVIIPHVISQWTTETKIFCNPKIPEVIGDIATDDWYDGDESIRYKVKGKVAVQVFAESSANEAAEGLQKLLKRHVSFRSVSGAEIDKVTKEKRTQFIIGDGAQKWMRVREGRLGGLGITF